LRFGNVADISLTWMYQIQFGKDQIGSHAICR
jgi:hypothetical protein